MAEADPPGPDPDSSSTGSHPAQPANTPLPSEIEFNQGDVRLVPEKALVKAAGGDQDPRPREMPPRFTGYKIFVAVLWLTAAFFVAFILFSALTYPYPNVVTPLLRKSPRTALEIYVQLKDAWVQQTVTLGQLLVFGSLVPLLGTIIGYVLGSNRRSDNDDD